LLSGGISRSEDHVTAGIRLIDKVLVILI
jgi:hypothetical protein